MPEFVVSQTIVALGSILNSLLELYFWIVLIAALLSWVNPDPRNPIVRFLYSVTEPVLYWLRRRLPFLIIGGFDLSPLVLPLSPRLGRRPRAVEIEAGATGRQKRVRVRGLGVADVHARLAAALSVDRGAGEH